MTSLLDEVLEAHGGIARWRAARSISARVRTGGFLPRTRMPGNRLADYRVTVDVAAPRAVLDPFPRDGQRGVFERGEARIESSSGEAIDSRADPRPAFRGLAGLRRNLRWDALDTVYFAGYTMWNYLTTPLLLTRDGVEVREGEDWGEGDDRWRRLEVSFPAEIDTHSSRQTMYFDARRVLRRHDYVAEVVGRWARAAHYCDEHAQAGGLVFPTRRWVRPVGVGNRAIGFPTLVSLELSELHVEPQPESE
jgi:hypothetical protein